MITGTEIAVTRASFDLLKLVGGILTTNPRRFLQLKARLEKFEFQHEDYCAQLAHWDKLWHYTGNHSEDIYRRLWNEQYEAIVENRNAIQRDCEELGKHLARVLGNHGENISAWRKYGALHRKKIIGALTFALASEESLTAQVTSLEQKFATLRSLSNGRLESIIGSSAKNAVEQPKLVDTALYAVNLRSFGERVSQLRKAVSTSDWALELCGTEYGSDEFDTWETLVDMTVLRVRFGYLMCEDQRRVTLVYSPKRPETPENWPCRVVPIRAPLAASPLALARQESISDEPAVSDNPSAEHKQDFPPGRKSRSFRDLFKVNFFGSRETRAQWQGDQARLLASLSRWAVLLWESDWITNACCSGIRYVCTDGDIEAESFHAITVKQLQAAINEEGHHRDLRLKNLGLVLAEIVCYAPFRQSRVGNDLTYQKFIDGIWQDISTTDLLKEVKKSSLASESLRKAVEFCLNTLEPGPRSGDLMDFYREIINKVVAP